MQGDIDISHKARRRKRGGKLTAHLGGFAITTVTEQGKPDCPLETFEDIVGRPDFRGPREAHLSIEDEIAVRVLRRAWEGGPPHTGRELAEEIGVSDTIISRAFAAAREAPRSLLAAVVVFSDEMVRETRLHRSSRVTQPRKISSKEDRINRERYRTKVEAKKNRGRRDPRPS